jgi:hypothetical protein
MICGEHVRSVLVLQTGSSACQSEYHFVFPIVIENDKCEPPLCAVRCQRRRCPPQFFMIKAHLSCYSGNTQQSFLRQGSWRPLLIRGRHARQRVSPRTGHGSSPRSSRAGLPSDDPFKPRSVVKIPRYKFPWCSFMCMCLLTAVTPR